MKHSLPYLISLSIFAAAFAFGCLERGLYAQPSGGGAIVAIDEAAGSSGSKTKENAGGAASNKNKYSQASRLNVRGSGKITRTKAPESRPQPRPPRPFSGPILGDKYTFLNFEVISAAKPIYRLKAKQSGASGLVQVEVLIGENGDVLTARARTGNKLLWDEAENAALASKFNRPTDNGRPARATGFLVYRFGKGDDDDDEP